MLVSGLVQLLFLTVFLYYLHCCWSTGQGPGCAWGLAMVAGGHQWCLSQGAGTNMQFSLSLLWPSALPDQDFQLAFRFCAIFGFTCECYQMSLPLESCARSELPHLSLLPSMAVECGPEAALHPSPSPGHGDTLLSCCTRGAAFCSLMTSAGPPALFLAQSGSPCAFLREEFVQDRFPCPRDLLCIPTSGSP